MHKRRIKTEEPKEWPVREKNGISFSFEFLQDASYTKCHDSGFFIKFLSRLKSLCQLGWNEINRSYKHSFGYEKIPVSCLKSGLALTKDIDYLFVFRATGDNHAFLGFREGNVFMVVFIESEFGDIYDHGSK